MPTPSQLNESLSRWNTTEDFGLQVARGQIRGHRVEHIFGYNPTIQANIEETIWTFAGIYQHAPSATVMTVSSNNANDSATGTGARTVFIRGVNGNGKEQNEIVTLNGQTAVSTTNSFEEINEVVVITVGSGGKNAGQIFVGTGTVTAGVPAQVYGHILAGENKSLMGHWTVPIDYTGYLIHGDVSSGVDTNGFVTARLKVRGADKVDRTAAIVTFALGVRSYDFTYPVKISGGACVTATAVSTKSGDKVTCYFQLLLIKNQDETVGT